MGKGKFTLGPWYEVDDRIRDVTSDAIVASIEDGGHVENEIFSPADRKKHARLIAAAPEMYEALEAALDLMEFHHPRPARCGEIARARAALSKARGEGS